MHTTYQQNLNNKQNFIDDIFEKKSKYYHDYSKIKLPEQNQSQVEIRKNDNLNDNQLNGIISLSKQAELPNNNKQIIHQPVYIPIYMQPQVQTPQHWIYPTNQFNYPQPYNQVLPNSMAFQSISNNQNQNEQLPYKNQTEINQHSILEKTKTQQLERKKHDLYIDKTPDQIVNEFKAQTLPKLRLWRLLKLQALMKGHYDKIIPDIVIEVMTYNKFNEDFSLYSTDYRIYLQIMERVIENVVKIQSKEMVDASTSNLVSNILQQRIARRPPPETDPLVLVAESLTTKAIKNLSTQIVKECTKETVNDYIIEQHFVYLLQHKYLSKMLIEVTQEALDEIILENYLENMITTQIAEFITPLSVHMLEELQVEAESEELGKTVTSYIQRGMLQVLLEQILFMRKQELGEQIPEEKQQSYQQTQQQKVPLIQKKIGDIKSSEEGIDMKVNQSKSVISSTGEQNKSNQKITMSAATQKIKIVKNELETNDLSKSKNAVVFLMGTTFDGFSYIELKKSKFHEVDQIFDIKLLQKAFQEYIQQAVQFNEQDFKILQYKLNYQQKQPQKDIQEVENPSLKGSLAQSKKYEIKKVNAQFTLQDNLSNVPKTDVEEYVKPQIESDKDDSEDEIEDNFEEQLLQKTKNQNFQKGRASVSAEAFGNFNKKTDYVPKVIKKTNDQKARITLRLQNAFMFQNLDEKEKAIVIDAMEEIKFK